MRPASPVTVSVALRVYNSSRFVGEQLASILAQTALPDQIVVGDDGSSDETLDIVVGMVDEARRSGATIELTLLPSEHVGIAANIQRTLAACNGEVVGVCDHDDRCHPTRFERIRREFEQRPDLMCLHGEADLIDENGAPLGGRLTESQLVTARERGRYAAGEAFEVLIRRNIVTGATAAFRRSLVPIAVPHPPDWVYDEWLGIVAAGMGGLGFMADPQLDYRQHSSNKAGVGRSTGQRAGMLLTSGTSRNARLVRRAEQLCEQLEELGPRVAPHRLALAEAKLAHERRRSRMPRNRLLRAAPVLSAAATGSYGRFARGRKDILLDLVQPRT
jgi:hypothetical protein